MSGFIFALVAVFLAAMGGRDQALLAQLTEVQGRRPLMLATALTAAMATTALAAWAGSRIVPTMIPDARTIFAAFALLFAAAEMLLQRPRKAAAEPTQSLFAAFLVLAGFQITDGARFLVLALSVGTAAPLPAAIGGAIGSGVALAAGWLMPGLPHRRELRIARRIAGAMLGVIGLMIAARAIIG